MGLERTRGRADLKRVQDRCIYFQKAAGIHKRTDGCNNSAALDKGIAHLRADDHIEITLAVAQIHVLQAMPLIRQGLEALA
ncbi:hypothetical protein SDC9_164021 [bioreactor metagenome]|uniref:Uncharacterized protein n=1 Tax=bioreactor metagenome TaxID=1076179 RepID=A0A645FSH7_9ZZZZ